MAAGSVGRGRGSLGQAPPLALLSASPLARAAPSHSSGLCADVAPKSSQTPHSHPGALFAQPRWVSDPGRPGRAAGWWGGASFLEKETRGARSPPPSSRLEKPKPRAATSHGSPWASRSSSLPGKREPRGHAGQRGRVQAVSWDHAVLPSRESAPRRARGRVPRFGSGRTDGQRVAGRGSSPSCFRPPLPQVLCQARAADLRGALRPLALWAQGPTPEVPTQPRGLGPVTAELTRPASASLREPSRSTSVQPGNTERETGPPPSWARRGTCSEEGAKPEARDGAGRSPGRAPSAATAT